MPAKTKILPQYKSYVGRIFLLRKHKVIPASKDQKARQRKEYNREEIFGDGCLIVNETNSRVRVTTLQGNYLWISKFYLHKELTGQTFNDHDYVVDLVDRLLRLNDFFDEFYGKTTPTESCSPEIKPISANQGVIFDSVKTLRQYADILRFSGPVSSSV